MPEWRIQEGFVPEITVSVIIAARNEAANIQACLNAVLNGNYPAELFEIIVVDDFSDDGTAEMVGELFWVRRPPTPNGGYICVREAFELIVAEGPSSDTMYSPLGGGGSHTKKGPHFKLLRLADLLPPEYRHKSNKKKAIEIAVAQSTGTIIVTTDADCIVPEAWLRLMVSRLTADPSLKILSAPVTFHWEHNLLQRFQALDFLGLMGITGAGIQLNWHRMGNGANLAYYKTAFEAVGGYSGNEQVASGDDMFLLQKIAARWHGSAGFLKNADATVLTEAKPTWNEFWQQRLRWGTKNAALPEWRIRLVLLMVWLFCGSILTGILLVLSGYLHWQVLVFQLIVKAASDWFFLRELCRYFHRSDLMRWFIPSFFVHTVYIAGAGLVSLITRKYEWKGRVVSD